MIELNISNYTYPFTRLNGQTSQSVTPLDLARAMVTIGQGSWTGVFNLGIFRIGELICKAMAFSKLEHGNLVLQDRFHNLNQSEKATVSYYFGQGLTKLYAENFFKIKWIFHVDDYDAFIQFNIKGTAIPKIIIGKTKKNADRPDLIGIKQKNVSHIFEAKGNSGGYDTSVMQHAINQVSQVKTYNGVSPKTKTACYFDLSTQPIKGVIIDPENDGNGIDIKFDEEQALINYYSFFIENKQYFSDTIKIGDYEYLTTPVGVPYIHFGFDKRLLEMKPEELLYKGLYSEDYNFLDIKKNEMREFSVGLDGIIIINYN